MTETMERPSSVIPQSLFSFIHVPNTLSATELTLGNDDFKALPPERQDLVRELRAQATDFAGGKRRTFCFVPDIEVFYLGKS